MDGFLTFLKDMNYHLKRFHHVFQLIILKKFNDAVDIINTFKQKYHEVSQGINKENIFNMDQTSFGLGAGLRTVVPKNLNNQPKIENVFRGSGVSIGCIISAVGDTLLPHLVAKGLTPRSLEKFGIYQDHPDCILTYSKNGWFDEASVLEMIECIGHRIKRKHSLLLLDALATHRTHNIITRAKELNITLLQIPAGFTSELQPLDYNFNGAFKKRMQSIWFNNLYN